MRILASVAAAACWCSAPVAFAHEGNPNFLSQIAGIDPAIDGVRP